MLLRVRTITAFTTVPFWLCHRRGFLHDAVITSPAGHQAVEPPAAESSAACARRVIGNHEHGSHHYAIVYLLRGA